MLVQRAKITTKLSLSINVEVILITEEDDAPDSNQTSKIILLGIRKLAQPHTMNLSANLRIVVEDVGSGSQKVAELRVTLQAFLYRILASSNIARVANAYVFIWNFFERRPM